MEPKYPLHYHLLVFSCSLLVVNLLQAYFSPVIDDEAYYWTWAQQLDWGFFDHPPMVALWIKLGFSVIENTMGLRLLTAIFGSAWVYFLGLILQPKTKQEFSLFVVLCLSGALLTVYQFITTPDSPLLFFTVLYCYVLKQYLNQRSWLATVLLGICMALLMYAKYHAALVLVFTLLPHVVKEIVKPKIYIAIAIAAMLYLPHVVWQANHDWVSLKYHLLGRQQIPYTGLKYTLEYLGVIAVVFSPFLIYHLIKANVRYKNQHAADVSYRFLLVGSLCFFLIISVFRRIQPQWVLIGMVPLLIITYQYYRTKKNAYNTLFLLGGITVFLIAVARVYLMVPNPPFKTKYHGAKNFMQAVGKQVKHLAVFEKYQEVGLYNYHNYPQKKAAIYVTLANRQSQFDLWNTEQEIEQGFTYVSKYAKAWGDSIVWQQHKPVPYYLKKFDAVQPIHRLAFEVTDVQQKKDSVFLTIKASNQHQYPIALGRQSTNQLYVVYGYGMHHVTYQQPLVLDSVNLPPMQSKVLSMSYLQTKEKGKHTAYIGAKPGSIVIKKQSDWFDVVVD